jgi:hypothetical protein
MCASAAGLTLVAAKALCGCFPPCHLEILFVLNTVTVPRISMALGEALQA